MTTKSTYFGNSVPVNVVDNALSVVDIREDGNRAAFGDYWQKQYKWLMS